MLALLILFFTVLLLVAFTPLLGYFENKWILPLMWGLFAAFTLLGWLVFLGIGWLNF